MPNVNGIESTKKKADLLAVFQNFKRFLNLKFRELKCLDKEFFHHFFGKKTSASIHLALPPPLVSMVSKSE